jgi:hypothetical protein
MMLTCALMTHVREGCVLTHRLIAMMVMFVPTIYARGEHAKTFQLSAMTLSLALTIPALAVPVPSIRLTATTLIPAPMIFALTDNVSMHP